jgi:S-adenosylmethionine decarboxylase
MNAGTEWLVDAEGCSAELIRDSEVLRILCEEVIAKLDLRVVGDPAWHRFPTPGGITGLYLLSESHLTFHTFPETGVATFNLYCCRPRPPFAWEERIRDLLGAAKVVVRTVDRGSEVVHPDLLETSDRASIDPSLSERTSLREVSGL